MSVPHDFIPELPIEIENAAQSGELVVFVGAGMSQLIKCPSWEGFADKVLDQLVPKAINYYELSQIKSIANPKKKLSIAKILATKNNIKIDYKSIFSVEIPKNNNVYEYLNSFNSSFVTTNYEKYLLPESRKSDPEKDWRFYKRDHLRVDLDYNGTVVHLHGCVDDPDSMVITTKDYLEHYSDKYTQDFLRYLFEKKTILFLGYGLEEIEVLEYILRRGGAAARSGNERIRRFMLQGCFKAEEALYGLLQDYYHNSFATDLIIFHKDRKNFMLQVEILAAWSKKLRFGKVTLADEVIALEEEING